MHQRNMVASSKVIRVGPWGGTGGSPWDDGVGYNGVRSITLTYGQFVESMRVEYDKNGRPFLGEQHGGIGARQVEIKLNFPNEFLTTVSGYCRPVTVNGGSRVVSSLTFKTNRREFGPFGVEEGIPFGIPMEGGVVVGFSGRSGWHLDAIGLYVSALRSETLCDKVQELGFMAYWSLVYGNGQHHMAYHRSPVYGNVQRREQQVQHEGDNVQNKTAFSS